MSEGGWGERKRKHAEKDEKRKESLFSLPIVHCALTISYLLLSARSVFYIYCCLLLFQHKISSMSLVGKVFYNLFNANSYFPPSQKF